MPFARRIGIALAVWILSVAACSAAEGEPKPNLHALLVGCTYYENLAKDLHLEGPANDSLLMRDLLTQRYGFPAANVRILAEHAGKNRLPSRKNIEAEMRRLAQIVKEGDQVVALLGGHGSLQPQSKDSPFPQPDARSSI